MKKEENKFIYTGPSSLKDIEERLLEIDAEKSARTYNVYQDYFGSFKDETEIEDIKYLDVERTQLTLKRQFILDTRNGWKAKVILAVITTIITAMITACISYVMTKL